VLGGGGGRGQRIGGREIVECGGRGYERVSRTWWRGGWKGDEGVVGMGECGGGVE